MEEWKLIFWFSLQMARREFKPGSRVDCRDLNTWNTISCHSMSRRAESWNWRGSKIQKLNTLIWKVCVPVSFWTITKTFLPSSLFHPLTASFLYAEMFGTPVLNVVLDKCVHLLKGFIFYHFLEIKFLS